MPDFLLEIGCEEIPARMIAGASRELRERVGALLERERLAPSGVLNGLDTPRRLAVIAPGIPSAQPDVTEQVTGPSAQVAFKDGQPTPAAHAFAKKVGVDVGKLEKVATPKGEYLGATVTRKGRATAEILAEALPERNCRSVLAEKYVLAQARRAFRPPGALAGGNARRTGDSPGDFSASPPETFRAGTGCWATKRRPLRAQAPMSRRSVPPRFWEPPSASK